MVHDAFLNTETGRQLLPQVSTESFLKKLGAKVVSAMNQLPKCTPFRKILLKGFFEGLTPSEISPQVNFCSASTISRSRRIKNWVEEIHKYKKPKNRKTYREEEVKLFAEFFRQKCPPKSGQTRLKQRMSNEALYTEYVHFVQQQNRQMLPFEQQFKIRSRKILWDFRKRNNVLLSKKIDIFECVECAMYTRNIARRDILNQKQNLTQCEKSELKTLKKNIATSEKHALVNEIQRHEFNYLRSNLKDDQIMLVMDFTALGQFGVSNYLQTLVLVEISRVGGREQFRYFDIFKQHSNDFWFFRIAIAKYFEEHLHQNRIKSVYLWSDGGGKHFKQRRSQHFLSTFPAKYKKNIHWNFFCSNHAHNMCDGHAAVLKIAVDGWRRDTLKPIPTEQEL